MPSQVSSAVIVVGGGPVGLIVALMLGRAGIKVTLFDQGDIVHSEPRAATIHPATLDILDDLGVYALIEPQGIVCPIVNYYDGKTLLAAFDHALLRDETRHPWVLQCDPVRRQHYRDEMRRRAGDPALAKAFLMRTALIDSLRDAARIV